MNRQRLIVFTAVLLFAASFSGCGGGNGNNPSPPPSDEKPTITISPTTAAVELGKSQSFTLKVSGQPAPTVTCSQPTQGTVSRSGNTVTYTAPTDPPAQDWIPSVPCTAQNRAGTAMATAQVTLNYPVPVINSIAPSSIYLSKEMIIGGMEVHGSGFYAGGAFQADNPESPFKDSVYSAEVSATRDKITWSTAFDTPKWAPRYLKITVSSPPGHGGGTSNPGWFAFLGNLNALTLSQTKAFFLYQGPVPGGEMGIGDRIQVFDLATGAQVNDFSIDSPSFVRQIAYEEVNSLILDTGYQAMGVWREDGSIKNAIGNDDNARPMSISSLDGNVCATFSTTGKIGWVTGLDLFSPPPFTLTATGNKPWNVTMSRMGEQLLCTVFDIQGLQLSVVKIPQLELYKSLILNGLTPADQMWGQGDGPEGGWQLDVFKSGSAANTAAVLFQKDNEVVFVDITSGTELRRVHLDGVPFRIAANNATGELIVAFSASDGKTHFKKIAVATGEVSDLSMTTPEGILATGLAVSTDGAKVYAAGYNPSGQPTFSILPIN